MEYDISTSLSWNANDELEVDIQVTVPPGTMLPIEPSPKAGEVHTDPESGIVIRIFSYEITVSTDVVETLIPRTITVGKAELDPENEVIQVQLVVKDDKPMVERKAKAIAVVPRPGTSEVPLKGVLSRESKG